MKKRLFTNVLAITLVLSLFASVAFADVTSNSKLEYVKEMVEETNAAIERDVATAQEIADKIIYIIGDNFISRMSIKTIIDVLEFETGLKAKAAINKAARLGVEVKCEIKVYMVGGQKAYIDPLFVISD
ncbi:hypothetical protein IMX26_06985 [Clostridium sp. 'deep sea']|uniref:hypothetical protein n=1 Tax=Clostridium sp. 'deep sea' TaxID=2779445 RepID=UPI00189648FE|nr:hypothetical protein [Clostridium sp. 'deep sea']QOR36546.1 hypothetical protein IMX26_06985 [Clostridium sp. 'deep sea']